LLILADITRLKNNEIALRKNLAKVEHLNALSRTLNKAFNLEEGVMFRMEAALRQVSGLTGASMCRLYRVDSGELVMSNSYNDPLFEQTGLVDTQSLGRAQQAFQTGQNCIFAFQDGKRIANDHYILLSSGFQATSLQAVSVQPGGLQPQGVLFLRVDENQISESEDRAIENLYEAVSLQLASALENITLYQEVKHLAQTDDLTRLLTRRYGFQLGETAFRYADRYQQPLAVVMMDLDSFKAVNDSFGHAAGDHVLREVSERIRTCLRVTDQACRYGGDELLIIMPGADHIEARGVAERLRVEIESRVFLLGDVEVSLTASMGVAGYLPNVDRQFDALVQRADQALYLAKQGGRNRVEVDPGPGAVGKSAEPDWSLDE
jgi:diguanylate cyclase (GGDEF)-like protein